MSPDYAEATKVADNHGQRGVGALLGIEPDDRSTLLARRLAGPLRSDAADLLLLHGAHLGGRLWTTLTTWSLLIPAVGIDIALQVTAAEILSPTAPAGDWNQSFIDYNVRAERMGWLPSAPALKQNSLRVAAKAEAAGVEPKDFVAKALKSGELELSCHDPDDPANWPRNMFVRRSNLLGSSGKGHEYFLKHLLGTQHGVMRDDLGAEGAARNREVVWRNEAPRGKLDLLVTLDFRMSTTCVYSDIVLPTATWYEKNDLNTSYMHPFIHPLSAAVDPAWEARSD